MKQFNTISKLLSTLISPEELIAIVEMHNYTDVARKFKVENPSLSVVSPAFFLA